MAKEKNGMCDQNSSLIDKLLEENENDKNRVYEEQVCTAIVDESLLPSPANEEADSNLCEAVLGSENAVSSEPTLVSEKKPCKKNKVDQNFNKIITTIKKPESCPQYNKKPIENKPIDHEKPKEENKCYKLFFDEQENESTDDDQPEEKPLTVQERFKCTIDFFARKAADTSNMFLNPPPREQCEAYSPVLHPPPTLIKKVKSQEVLPPPKVPVCEAHQEVEVDFSKFNDTPKEKISEDDASGITNGSTARYESQQCKHKSFHHRSDE